MNDIRVVGQFTLIMLVGMVLFWIKVDPPAIVSCCLAAWAIYAFHRLWRERAILRGFRLAGLVLLACCGPVSGQYRCKGKVMECTGHYIVAVDAWSGVYYKIQ